jgi:hypothetical protein
MRKAVGVAVAVGLCWREFSEHDWCDYMTSSTMVDGSPPLIADLTVDGCEAVAILEEHGVSVMWVVDDVGFTAYGLGMSTIARMQAHMTWASLEAAGFEIERDY